MSPDVPHAPMETIARRAAEIRARKKITAKELGERLAEMGVRWDRFTVASLESGKRQNLTIVEWLALARALDVAPIHLLVDPEGSSSLYQVTPNEAAPEKEVRAWLRGMSSLGGTDLRIYYSEIPRWEWGCLWVLTKPKADLDEDTPIREMSRWVRTVYAGYGEAGVIGDDNGEG